MKTFSTVIKFINAVATVLTVHGIETKYRGIPAPNNHLLVATVLTVHGIETIEYHSCCFLNIRCNSAYRSRY